MDPCRRSSDDEAAGPGRAARPLQFAAKEENGRRRRVGIDGFLDDAAKRNHDLRHRGLQFERRGLWVSDVGDDELGQPCEQPHGLREVLRLRLVEVEDNGEVAALAQLLPQTL
jgi:hypothetical protein